MRPNYRTDGIKIRYIYSACIVTITPDISILHDPWFTEGIYDGSWFQFPQVLNPVESVGDVDFIYISHIHPDHYDCKFLKKYFTVYGVKKILIAKHSPNHLAAKMRADGFEATIIDSSIKIGKTEIQIIPHITGSASDIDSACIIKYQSTDSRMHCIVNANDVIFDENMANKLKLAAGSIDIFLCGYTGAGPYPQTYFDSSDPQLVIEAESKKKKFFDRYIAAVNVMDARVNIPFAGKYILGGKLSGLNGVRGVADPTEVLEIDEKAIVLADNGGEINTSNFIASAIRTAKYNNRDLNARLDELKSERMDYERLFLQSEVAQLPLKRLLVLASRNATRKSECYEDYYFCINLPNNQFAVLNANRNEENCIYFTESSQSLPNPRSQILIDPRYLFGLLTHIYHWDNAEIGSQYITRRTPNVYKKEVQTFLHNLTV